eukprot:116007_1
MPCILARLLVAVVAVVVCPHPHDDDDDDDSLLFVFVFAFVIGRNSRSCNNLLPREGEKLDWSHLIRRNQSIKYSSPHPSHHSLLPARELALRLALVVSLVGLYFFIYN